MTIATIWKKSLKNTGSTALLSLVLLSDKTGQGVLVSAQN
jgi:hypothetical protein